MAVRFLVFFAAIILVAIIYLAFQKPHFIKKESSKEQVPLFEFIDVSNYNITKEGIELYVKAKKAVKFTDYDKMYNVEAKMKRKGFIESLRADIATLKDKVLDLEGDTRYERSDGVTLKSKKIQYLMQSRVLISKAPFVLSDKNSIVYGDSFVYDIKKGTISAKKIKSVIDTEY
jgi:LPS export ABC transporter protein LptC